MKKDNSSYNQILKSTSIFGGSQALVIIIGVIRTKIIALLLGPAGVGIIGIYQSVIDMIRTGSGLGIDTGGVREIAASTDNNFIQNKTVYRLNWWFLGTALLGLLVCGIFCYPISIWAFESDAYALPIALLSICVFLAILTTGRSVVLQGMRKISYMAQSAVWGSFIGLVLTIPLYYFFGLKGIVPAFIVSSLVLYFCTEFYYKKLNLKLIKTSNKEVFEAGLSTLKLGLFIVLAGIINTVSMFVIRAFLTRSIDIEAAGLFQSAWTITNVYLGLILKSMGSDFFPRLSAIADKKEEIKKLVNEQSYIVLVVATPIIIGMLLFSDFALSVLYSSKFTYANTILEWQILGTFLKVLGWPIAFIILAKNKGPLFLLSEALFYVSYLGAFYLLFPSYGLDAAGIGYLIAYVIYLPVVFIIGKSISSFTWNGEVIRMIIMNLLLICGTFYITQNDNINSWIFGSIVLLASMIYSLFKLRKVFSIEDLKDWFRRK